MVLRNDEENINNMAKCVGGKVSICIATVFDICFSNYKAIWVIVRDKRYKLKLVNAWAVLGYLFQFFFKDMHGSCHIRNVSLAWGISCIN